MEPLHIFNYTITADPEQVDDGRTFSEAMAMVFMGMQKMIVQMDPHAEAELKQLIRANPQEPVFRNQLTNYYRIQGKMEKAYVQNRETLKLFPDYVYARTNLVHEYIETGQTEKVEEVFGRLLEIGDMLPQRRVFHVGEVIAFNQAVIRYLITTNNFGLIENRIEQFMKVLDMFPGVPGVQFAALEDDLQFAKIRAGFPVEGLPIPKLNNPLLRELYCNSLRIDVEMLEKILALPKETLIEDLSIILRNSCDQFYQWIQVENDPRIIEHNMHALYLLSALGDDSALPVVLGFLKQSFEVLEFWLGDSLCEEYWKFIYVLGQNQLDQLFRFILQPGVDPIARSVISQAIHQIPLLHPERRTEVLQWYRELLHELNSRPEIFKNTDEHHVDLYLADMVDFNAVELEEEMIRAHKNFLPEDDDMFRGLDEMINSLRHENNSRPVKNPFPDIFTVYQETLMSWEYYIDERDLKTISDIRSEFVDDDIDETEDDFDAEIQDDLDEVIDDLFDFEDKPSSTGTFFAPPTPGRNDPCPCGSGKKYKKCCMLN